MRTLSLDFRRALFSQESGEVAIFLLTVTHPDLADPILLSSDATVRLTSDPLVYGTQSRGDDYLYVAMQVTLPDEKDKGAPASKLVIANIDRSLIPLIRSITSPASVKIEGVLASDPDTVEFTVPRLDIASAEFNADQISFDLIKDAMTSAPYPAESYNPAFFPGLF